MNEDEFLQCLQDVENWFERNGAADELKPMSVPSAEDVEGLAKRAGGLDRGLELVLKRCQKRIYFLDKELLSLQEIHRSLDDLEESKGWEEGVVPFAKDMQDGFFGVDGRGRMVEIDDEGDVSEYASSFSDFLEGYRNDMLSSALEYMGEDLGVVEILTK